MRVWLALAAFLVLAACDGLLALVPTASLVPDAACPAEDRADPRLCTVSAVRAALIARYVRGKTPAFAAWLAGFDATRPAILSAPTDDAYRIALSRALDKLGDGHTGYTSPAGVKAQDELFRGVFPTPGAGILSALMPEGLLVTSVLSGSPAEATGLRRGDLIVATDAGACHPRCAPALRVAKSVGWLRGGQRMEAAIAPMPNRGFFPVSATRIGDVGVLTIPHFLSPVLSREIDAALGSLTRPTPPRALIIDVRSNPGGLVLMMRHLLSRLLPPGNYGRGVNRDGETTPFTVPAIPGGPEWARRVPVAVLVDTRTRSAGELTAAILQKAGRAIVAGTATPGETETVWAFDLADGGRISISVSDYFRQGETLPLSAQGIRPDLPLPGTWYTQPGDPWITRAARALIP